MSETNVKLLEFSQTTPDITLLSKYYKQWENYLPFDGIVTDVAPEKDRGGLGHFSYYLGRQVFRPASIMTENDSSAPLQYTSDYHYAINEIKDIKFEKFNANFLYLMMNDNSWYYWLDEKGDHWPTILQNLKGMAEIAKMSGMKGILIDVEMYGSHQPFSYRHNKDYYKEIVAEKGSWIDKWRSSTEEGFRLDFIRKKVWCRGKEVITAIAEEFPEAEIIFSHGPAYVLLDKDPAQPSPYEQVELDDGEYKGTLYGLLVDFFKGALEAADELNNSEDTSSKILLVEGTEASYYYKSEEEFFPLLSAYNEAPDLFMESTSKEKYKKKVKRAFGLFPSHTKMEDHQFKDGLTAALKCSNSYVFTWNEQYSFWINPDVFHTDTMNEWKKARSDMRYIDGEYDGGKPRFYLFSLKSALEPPININNDKLYFAEDNNQEPKNQEPKPNIILFVQNDYGLLEYVLDNNGDFKYNSAYKNWPLPDTDFDIRPNKDKLYFSEDSQGRNILFVLSESYGGLLGYPLGEYGDFKYNSAYPNWPHDVGPGWDITLEDKLYFTKDSKKKPILFVLSQTYDGLLGYPLGEYGDFKYNSAYKNWPLPDTDFDIRPNKDKLYFSEDSQGRNILFVLSESYGGLLGYLLGEYGNFQYNSAYPKWPHDVGPGWDVRTIDKDMPGDKLYFTYFTKDSKKKPILFVLSQTNRGLLGYVLDEYGNFHYNSAYPKWPLR